MLTCLVLLLLTLLELVEFFPIPELMEVPESMSSRSKSADLNAPPILSEILDVVLRAEPVADPKRSPISDERSLMAEFIDEETLEEMAEEEMELLETFFEETLLLSLTDVEEDFDERSIFTLYFFPKNKMGHCETL